jgi:hypothetical protein
VYLTEERRIAVDDANDESLTVSETFGPRGSRT